MEIWLIKDGEKIGPFPEYEIRGRIQKGELKADDPLWHDGLAAWTKAVEIELFRKEFDEVFPPQEPPPLPAEYLERAKTAKAGESGSAQRAPEVKPRAYVARRFWARWMDLMAYSAIWWLGMYYSGRDIAAIILNPWMLLSLYLPWFLVEAWLIHSFGTTPGKWLLGLKVRNEDDSLLSLKSAIWRSVRVLVSGIGFGWQLLSPLCQGMSWFTTRRIGKPIWDYLGGHKVVAASLNPFKIGILIIVFVTAVQLQMAVRWPHEKIMLEEAYPDSKLFFNGDDVWTLPVKNQKVPRD